MSHVSGRVSFVLSNALLELKTAERMISPTDQRLKAELVAAQTHIQSAALLIDARLDPNPEWYQGNLSQLLTDEV